MIKIYKILKFSNNKNIKNKKIKQINIFKYEKNKNLINLKK